MKEHRLVFDGSVCEGDYIDGIDTVQQLTERTEERERCEFFPSKCPMMVGDGPYCIPRAAHDVATYTIKLRTSVSDELQDFLREAPMGDKGYFDPTVESPDNRTFDKAEVTERVGKWTERILGIQSVDAVTINHEFKSDEHESGLDAYSVLAQSTRDPENGTWVHVCGTVVSEAKVMHPLHTRALQFAGSGRVKIEVVPYCTSCEQKPSEHGDVLYEEDEDAREREALRKILDK